jgi:hypothetical protein
MGDPITTGILIGAAMGGGTAAIKGDDPLKGALIGGATGGIGGGLAGGFGGAAGAGTGGGFTGGGYGSVGTSGFTALNSGAGAGSSLGGLFGGSGGSGGMFSGMTMPSTITGIGKDISAANSFMNANPTTSQIGFGLAKEAFSPEQAMQMAPAGQIQRGQIQPMDYMSLLNPQNQQVMRPPQISLLG